MAETRRTLLFSVYSDTGVVTPWQSGNSTPAYPSGYTQGGDPAKILSGKYLKFSGSGNSVLLDDTVLSGNEIAVEGQLTTVSSDSQGLCICSPSGTGYQVLFNSTNTRIFAMTSFVLGTQVGTSIAYAATSNHVARLERNNTTGVMTISTGVDASSLTVRGSVTQSNANTDWRAGVFVRSAATISSLVSGYTPAQTVTSINGGSPITSSQSAVAAITTGFSGLPTTITTNATGVTCGTISGTTNAPTWMQTVRTDGAVFPKSGTVVTYTFTKSAETASGTQTINKDTDQTAVIVASPINDDTTCLFGAIFAVTGRSAANLDEVYHAIPAPMLTNGIDTILPADAIAPDGTMQFYNAGTFPCWIWTAATGINYYYLVTITESGGVVITSSSKNHYIGLGLGIGF